MGFIQAFKGAVGGMLADQWKDFLTIPNGLPQTAALFPAVPQGTNAGRGANTRGSENVITNGSKILVPQGYGLITVVDGRATEIGRASCRERVAKAGVSAGKERDIK